MIISRLKWVHIPYNACSVNILGMSVIWSLNENKDLISLLISKTKFKNIKFVSLYKWHKSLNDIHVYLNLFCVCFIQMPLREVFKEQIGDRKGVIRSPTLKWNWQYHGEKRMDSIGPTMTYKTLHRRLTIEQHSKPGWKKKRKCLKFPPCFSRSYIFPKHAYYSNHVFSRLPNYPSSC